MSKKALGKGLDALFSDIVEGPAIGNKGNEKPDDDENSGLEKNLSEEHSIVELPLERIIRNPNQPRKTFDNDSLEELAISVKEKGVLQPVLVQREDDRYVLVAGERRFRAAQLAGLEAIPAIVVSYDEEERYEIALIENIQREDLLPIDEALAYSEIMRLSGCSQERLAARLGKKRSTVANSLRLLKLPAPMRDALQEGVITPGHARAILSVNDEGDREKLFRRIVSEGLSVRQAEDAAGNIGTAEGGTKKKAGPETKLPVELKEMEGKFLDIFGTKIAIKGNLRNGKIEISYYSLEDLERIYDIVDKLSQK